MDKLDQLIQQKAQEIAGLDDLIASIEASVAAKREERRMVSIELGALKTAASLRPLVSPESEKGDAGEARKRGRQPGSISHEWRKVLGWLYIMSGPHDYAAIHQAAHEHGIQASYSSIRDRVRDYIKQGLLDGSPDDGFTVTEDAVERFNLMGEETSESPIINHDTQNDPLADVDFDDAVAPISARPSVRPLMDDDII